MGNLLALIESDFARLIVMTIGGLELCLSIAVAWGRDGLRDRGGPETAVLLPIFDVVLVASWWALLASKFGDQLTWYTPVAAVLFSLRLRILWTHRTQQMNYKPGLHR